MAVLLVYAGLILMFLGAVSLLKPVKFLRIKTRVRAAQVLGLGFLVFVVGAALPASELHAARVQDGIDRFMPTYQFHEFHATRIHASPAEVFRSIKTVTAREIWLFRALTWIRSPRLTPPQRESIMAAPADKPLLEVAQHDFLLLEEDPDRELVLGTIVMCPEPLKISNPHPQDFIDFHRARSAKATINFRITDEGAGWSRVTTETRVFATDAAARRRFAVYWRIIYPGSALIRRSWLSAIKRRAENPESYSRLIGGFHESRPSLVLRLKSLGKNAEGKAYAMGPRRS